MAASLEDEDLIMDDDFLAKLIALDCNISMKNFPDEYDNQELNQDDMEGKLTYLTQEFRHLGIIPYNEDQSNLNFIGLIDATYNFLQVHYKKVKEMDELNDRVLKMADGLSNLQLNNSRLKGTIEQKERQIAVHQENERSLRCENTTFTTKIKSDKDEIRRLNSVIQAKEVQYRNEIRKRECQFLKLKDKLSDLLTAKNGLRRAGAEITNPIQPKIGSRCKWMTESTAAKAKEEFKISAVHTLERRIDNLTEENLKIHQTLKTFLKRFEELGQVSAVLFQGNEETEYSKSIQGNQKLWYENIDNMPFEAVQDLIDKNFQKNMQRLETFIKQQSSLNT